jgi:hypothetical protein
MQHLCNWKKNALWNWFFVLDKHCPFMINNNNLSKRVKNFWISSPLNDIKYQLCYLKRCLYTQKLYLFIITCSFFVFVENCYLQTLCWNSWLQNDRDIRLLIKFITVYTCITFHFYTLALGEKGVFYSMFVNIRYSTIKKKEAAVLNIPQYGNTGNFFCFNSSLSNLYNNVIIYKIKKVVRTILFVNEFTEFSLED